MSAQMIRLVLLSGQPNGLRFIQLAGRTTMLTACPMTTRSEIYNRPEGDRPAVYILVGPDPDGMDRDAVYIGECDSLKERFRGGHHALGRTEWAEIYVATTTDGILNKAHALFVEDLLRKRVEATGLARDLTERSSPPTLDEGDQAFSVAFADDISLLARVLGLGVFAPRARQLLAKGSMSMTTSLSGTLTALHSELLEADLPIFEYSTKGARGLMQPSGSEFILLEGSTLAKSEAATAPGKAVRVRAEGLAAGLIVDRGGTTLEVTKNIDRKSVV